MFEVHFAVVRGVGVLCLGLFTREQKPGVLRVKLCWGKGAEADAKLLVVQRVGSGVSMVVRREGRVEWVFNVRGELDCSRLCLDAPRHFRKNYKRSGRVRRAMARWPGLPGFWPAYAAGRDWAGLTEQHERTSLGRQADKAGRRVQ
jgi:hypothetical protein